MTRHPLSLSFLPAAFALLGTACGGPSLEAEETSAIINGDPDPPDPPPPNPSSPPTAPGLALTERTNNRIVVRWGDLATNETGNAIERRTGLSTTWFTIATYGALGGGWRDFTDANRTADTKYCYRVRAWNTYGTRYSPTRCAWTRGSSSRSLWRLQLLVGVANVSDAGTDDGLSVRLNAQSSAEMPYGQLTHMDYSRDDFERNSTFTYDLDMAGVADLSDINRIDLFKDGSDGICLSRVALIANGVTAYDRVFSTCQWLDDSGGYTNSFSISHANLRSSSAWLAYAQPSIPPLSFPRAEIESRLEGLVGHAIDGTEVHWGHIYGRAVEVGRVSDDTMSLDLDLEASVDWLPNPEVDVDMQLLIEFVPGATAGSYDLAISTVSSSINVDYAWWAELISIAIDPLCAPIASIASWDLVWDCASSLEGYIENRVENALQPIERAFGVGGISCAPVATVGSDGSLAFGCQ